VCRLGAADAPSCEPTCWQQLAAVAFLKVETMLTHPFHWHSRRRAAVALPQESYQRRTCQCRLVAAVSVTPTTSDDRKWRNSCCPGAALRVSLLVDVAGYLSLRQPGEQLPRHQPKPESSLKALRLLLTQRLNGLPRRKLRESYAQNSNEGACLQRARCTERDTQHSARMTCRSCAVPIWHCGTCVLLPWSCELHTPHCDRSCMDDLSYCPLDNNTNCIACPRG
jgi:hypothetical protein